MIKELSCQFGQSNRLNGIVTVPRGEIMSNVALVLVTAGFTPKSGPFRLYTLIARKAASCGLVAMRFDLGGIGNSEQMNSSLPLEKRTEIDIRDAIDYLNQSFGIKQFILGGLCSGAEDSFKYAKDHKNILGVILMDGHAYPTLGFYLRFIVSRKFVNKTGRWIFSKLGLMRLVSRSSSSLVASLEGDQSGLVDYQQLDKEKSSSILQSLVNRGTKLLYIYTAGMDDKFNGKRQFNEMYSGIDFMDSVSVSYLPRMPHVQVFEEDRELICSVIAQWLEANFLAAKRHVPLTN